MIIYKITNKVNNKIYIGQTTSSLEERWSSHLSHSKHNKGSIIGNAINKYGAENFTIEQIDSALSLEELNTKEKTYIDLYKSMDSDIGYNLMSGGNNSLHSPATKLKMSLSKLGKVSNRKGKQSSVKTKQKQSQSLKGRPKSEEHKAKIRNALTGKPKSEEAKKNLSKACMGRIPWNKKKQ